MIIKYSKAKELHIYIQTHFMGHMVSNRSDELKSLGETNARWSFAFIKNIYIYNSNPHASRFLHFAINKIAKK